MMVQCGQKLSGFRGLTSHQGTIYTQGNDGSSLPSGPLPGPGTLHSCPAPPLTQGAMNRIHRRWTDPWYWQMIAALVAAWPEDE